MKRFKVRSIRRRAARKVRVSVKLPGGLPAGTRPLRVCVDTRRKVRERREANNCRRVGTLVVHENSRPKNPVSFSKNRVFKLDAYWIYVPTSYDATHNTPFTLFVWLHGCGGLSSGDISTVSPGGAQNYIAIAPDGREGSCWNVSADPATVLAAVAAVRTHFNINRRRVIVGGYSSGGDLAYRTAFYNASLFAGVLAENTSPFRDTGSSESASLAAATWRFNVVHLAHTDDDTYPIAGVREETDAMKAAGFPIQRIERPGGHFDDDTATTGTDHDLRMLLLPRINDGWMGPK